MPITQNLLGTELTGLENYSLTMKWSKEDIFIHNGTDTVRMYNAYWSISQVDKPSPVFVDDAACVPSPASLSLLIIGASIAFFRRSRRV